MTPATKTANRLIKQYGDTAPEIAANRAAECEQEGKSDARLYWSNVVVETKALLARDHTC